MGKKHQPGNEHVAVAHGLDLPISTKHSAEISRYLRYKNTTLAKKFLEGVIKIKVPVPYKTHTKDLGHKKGIGAGRYPEKAAREFLKLIKSVEANAQVKGLNTANLKITKILANKASIPFSGGRQRRASKRSHLEIEVTELGGKSEGKKGNSKEGNKENSNQENAPKPSAPKAHSPSAPSVKHPEAALVETPKPMETKPHEGHSYREEKPSFGTKGMGNKETSAASIKPVHEPSPAELLRQAQAKAALLNTSEKQKADVSKVESLFEELQKKGTLRK